MVLTTSHLHIQLDAFASQLTIYDRELGGGWGGGGSVCA